MSKKRGFTLVEVLVVVALTSLVFALVGGTFVFLASSSGDLIEKSEELILTQTIEKHLRTLDKNNDNKINFAGDSGNGYCIYDDANTEPNVIWKDSILTIGETQYTDTGLSSFQIWDDDKGFIRCTMKYQNGGTYTFIIGIKN